MPGHLCNRFGLDTISAGSAIALAYLLYERGLSHRCRHRRAALQWGDIETAHTLLEMIARRQGFGDVLAQGVKRIAARYGAEDLAVHVNGLEPGAHDPRALSGMAVVYATSPRGACHMQARHVLRGHGPDLCPKWASFPAGASRRGARPRWSPNVQDWRTLYNSAIMCVFVNPTAPVLVKLLSEATGWSSDLVWWQRAGERIFTLKRAFNNRLGVRRGNDRLPQRMLIPMSNGSRGRTPRMDKLIEEYYGHRDWDWETGKPIRGKADQPGPARNRRRAVGLN